MKIQLNSKKCILLYVYVLFIATIITGFVSCNSVNTSSTEDAVKEIADSTNQENLTDVAAEHDAMFLVEAAGINSQEIALGKLAKEKSKNSSVKELAQMMIDDHTKTFGDLKALAARKSITLPEPIADSAIENYNDLSKNASKVFDKAYCDEMINGHKKAIEKFEYASNNATDADIKAWAASVLPALKMHLQHSEECQKKCAAM